MALIDIVLSYYFYWDISMACHRNILFSLLLVLSYNVFANEVDDINLLVNAVGQNTCHEIIRKLSMSVAFVDNGVINGSHNYIGNVNKSANYNAKMILLFCKVNDMLSEVRVVANKGDNNSNYAKYNAMLKGLYSNGLINLKESAYTSASYLYNNKIIILNAPQNDYEMNLLVRPIKASVN